MRGLDRMVTMPGANCGQTVDGHREVQGLAAGLGEYGQSVPTVSRGMRAGQLPDSLLR